jgi:hypothetical protein
MSSSTTLNAEKNKPYLLAFFFAPNLPITVTAEVQEVEDGTKQVVALPRDTGLSNDDTWVYMAYHTFSSVGWHIVHYRANKSPGGEFVSSDIRRVLVVEPTSVTNAPTELVREVQDGMKVTAFNTVLMNNRGILSFKTRTR